MSAEARKFEQDMEAYGESLKEYARQLENAAGEAEAELRDEVSERSISRLHAAAEMLEKLGEQVADAARSAQAQTAAEERKKEEQEQQERAEHKKQESASEESRPESDREARSTERSQKQEGTAKGSPAAGGESGSRGGQTVR